MIHDFEKVVIPLSSLLNSLVDAFRTYKRKKQKKTKKKNANCTFGIEEM